MRANLHAYDLRTARSLAEALDLLSREPGRWRPFAGGTDLMVLFDAGLLPHTHFLSVWELPELRGVRVDDDHISLGALTTYAEVLRHGTLTQEFPLLAEAAAATGGVATQNRGTLGGNIANASPAADTPPALLAYDAELELVSTRGPRRIPYHAFHRGYKQMDLAPDELLHRIILPRGRAGWFQAYRKVGTRRAQAIAKVCFAGSIRVDSGRVLDVRLAFGSVAPTVLRAAAAERALAGEPLVAATAAAVDALDRDIAPVDDHRSSARYRRQIARNLLADFLGRASNARNR
jgi:CO/xanthine dehydrogenase FAD-binding subunit